MTFTHKTNACICSWHLQCSLNWWYSNFTVERFIPSLGNNELFTICLESHDCTMTSRCNAWTNLLRDITSLLISRKLYLQETQMTSKLTQSSAIKPCLFCVNFSITFANSSAPSCCVIELRIFPILRMQRVNSNIMPKDHNSRSSLTFVKLHQ